MKNTITYCGKNWLSRNQVDSYHWTKRMKYKEALWSELDLSSFSEPLNEFRVEVFYNSRFDVDNVGGGLKMVIDHLKHKGFIIDDNPKYFKQLSITFDATLPKSTYIVTLYPI